MSGSDVQPQAILSYPAPGARVLQDHSLRPIRKMVSIALAELDGDLTNSMEPGEVRARAGRT
jgi:hypothetical protein